MTGITLRTALSKMELGTAIPVFGLHTSQIRGIGLRHSRRWGFYRFAALSESFFRTLTSTRPPLTCFAAVPTPTTGGFPMLIT